MDILQQRHRTKLNTEYWQIIQTLKTTSPTTSRKIFVKWTTPTNNGVVTPRTKRVALYKYAKNVTWITLETRRKQILFLLTGQK